MKHHNEIHYFVQLIMLIKWENNSKISFKNLCVKSSVYGLTGNKKRIVRTW